MRTQIDELCRELASFILLEEETDSGRVFRPIEISSCRVMYSMRINEILKELKQYEHILRESRN